MLAQELGLRPLVARCHLGLATIYRKTGRQRQAGEASTIAIGLLRDMGMRYWLKRVEEEQGKSE